MDCEHFALSVSFTAIPRKPDCSVLMFLQLYKPIASHTNVKNFQQALEWMSTAIEDFGVGMLNLKVRSAEWSRLFLSSALPLRRKSFLLTVKRFTYRRTLGSRDRRCPLFEPKWRTTGDVIDGQTCACCRIFWTSAKRAWTRPTAL